MNDKYFDRSTTKDALDDLQFSDIFVIDEIQRLQDLFSDASGVASIITQPNGTPITKPSNFCRLCIDIIRKTDKGLSNCYKSDAALGCLNQSGPVIQPCLSGGLWDAGASITVGGKHIANWLIGQVRSKELDEKAMLNYADEIGANRTDFMNALAEVPIMSVDHFSKVSKMLFAFVNELSEKAYSNLQLKKQNLEREKASELLKASEEKFRALFDTMPIGFYHSTKDGYFIDINPALVKMLGYDCKEELLKVNIPIDIYFNASEREENIKKNKNLENRIDVYQVKTKDGRILWFEDYATYIKDENGNLKYNEGFCRDITERKKAEEILLDSEEKYRYMFANNPQPMMIYDLESLAFLEVNNSLAENYGFTREEFMKMTLKDIHLEEDIPWLIEDVERAKQTKNPGGECRHIKKNGELRYVELASHSITYKNRNARHVLIHDITDRKRAEAALRASEEKFRQLITNIKDVVYSIDVNTKEFKYLSPSFEKITGYSQEDIKKMGGRPKFLYKVVSKEKFEEWDNNLQKLNDGKIDCDFTHETWWLCKDGSYKCLQDHWTPIYENGKLVSTDGVLIDITERKQAEETLAKEQYLMNLLMENVPEYIYFKDIESRFIRTSKALANLFKLSNPSLAVGKTDFDFFTKEHASQTFEDEKRIIQTGQPLINFEEKETLDNGQTSWVSTTKLPMYDKDGNIIGTMGISHNITERKLFEEELIAEKRLLNAIIENIPDQIYSKDINSRFILCNSAVIRNIELNNTTEVIGKTDFDLFPEQFAKQYYNDEQELMKSGIPLINHEEIIVNKKTSEVRWNLSTKVPLRNTDGDTIGLIGINRDITERKQAEEALKASEEKFRNLFENMTNGFYRSTPDGYYIDANPAFIKMLGYESKEELLKVYIPTEMYVQPIERINVIGYINNFDNNFEVYRLKTKDGRIIWIEDNARYIKDNNGKIIYHEGICRDITERRISEEKLRESEEKLSTLFGAMTEMVALHELVYNNQGEAIDYIITDCNNSFTEITGIKKEDAIGNLASKVYQTDPPPYLNEFTRVALTGEPFEYDSYYAPMDKHFMISVVSPKKNQFATITTDITAIKQIQEVISAKSKELENYLYVASHDLRSPMVNIQGFSQRLHKQSDTINTILSECQFEPDVKERLDKVIIDGIPKTLNFILSNVTKMDILINGLLQISRTGRIKMNISKIDMNKLFKTIISSFNFQITDFAAKLIVEDLPDCYGDEDQLNQLFSNIIGNALKYKDKVRPLTIEISGSTKYNKVIYSIKDNGIGIAPKYLEKIWDVFFRVDSNSPEAGEGIGLSLAKRIIDKHRGKIWVESEESVGSTFYIELQKKEFTE